MKSFADKETEKVFRGQVSRRLPADIQQTARRKLLYLGEADILQDLRAPPANRLEALKGNSRPSRRSLAGRFYEAPRSQPISRRSGHWRSAAAD
ncbi:MAG: type II toxin-antitoxin system RelE/ParE family toxin [Chloroflexi bacterium]|nr:type II toxin-antitoxin system RelE/ParE family toxin [Chloroflexota bacterium]